MTTPMHTELKTLLMTSGDALREHFHIRLLHCRFLFNQSKPRDFSNSKDFAS